MPVIKTGQWLAEWRNARSKTIDEAASFFEINTESLQDIEEGRSLGSPKQWEQIYTCIARDYPDDIRLNKDEITNEEEVSSLQLAIQERGMYAKCLLDYSISDNGHDIIFYRFRVDYDPQDIIDATRTAERVFVIETSLEEALAYFEYQAI